MTKKIQIVIAWTEDEQVLVRAGRVDLGEMHKFKTVQSPRACMWLNAGKEADVAKAKEFAAREGKRVFCYTGSRDPLSEAKREVAA